jgi:hypothetical protein
MGFFDDLTAIVHEVTSVKDEIINNVKEPFADLSETVTGIADEVKKDGK